MEPWACEGDTQGGSRAGLQDSSDAVTATAGRWMDGTQSREESPTFCPRWLRIWLLSFSLWTLHSGRQERMLIESKARGEQRSWEVHKLDNLTTVKNLAPDLGRMPYHQGQGWAQIKRTCFPLTGYPDARHGGRILSSPSKKKKKRQMHKGWIKEREPLCLRKVILPLSPSKHRKGDTFSPLSGSSLSKALCIE